MSSTLEIKKNSGHGVLPSPTTLYPTFSPVRHLFELPAEKRGSKTKLQAPSTSFKSGCLLRLSLRTADAYRCTFVLIHSMVKASFLSSRFEPPHLPSLPLTLSVYGGRERGTGYEASRYRWLGLSRAWFERVFGAGELFCWFCGYVCVCV